MRTNASPCHIAYACNDAYAIPTGVSLFSLFENNKDLTLCVHLFSEGISEENKATYYAMAKSFGQEIIIQDMPDLNTVAGKELYIERLSLSTYLRLFLVVLLPKDVHSILWLDSDTLIVGSIKELFEEDISNYSCAGALNILKRTKRLHGFDNTEKYYNAGVLVLNLDYWREHKIYAKIISEIKRRGGKSIDHDQDLLNCILKGTIKTLSPKFNFITHYAIAAEDYDKFLRHSGLDAIETYSHDEIVSAMADVRIYHLIVAVYDTKTVRPWYSNNRHLFGTQWLEYLKKTPYKEALFPMYPGEVNCNGNQNRNAAVRTMRKALVYLLYNVPILRKLYVLVNYGFWHK